MVHLPPEVFLRNLLYRALGFPSRQLQQKMKTSHSTLTMMINVHDDNNARMTEYENVRNCRFEFHHKAVFVILGEKIPLIR